MADSKSPRRRPVASRRRSVTVDASSFDDSVSSVGEPMALRSAVCGHEGCDDACNVRYVGAVSQITDHHIVKASHATSHIWAAAVISGLAVVLTGAVAYTSVQAESSESLAAQQATYATQQDINVLLDRIVQLQDTIEQTKQACSPIAPDDLPGDGSLNPLPRAGQR
jgi:hypothetical protein